MRYAAVLVAFIFIVVSGAWITSAFIDVPFIPAPEPVDSVDPSVQERLNARFEARDIAIFTGAALVTVFLLSLAQRNIAAQTPAPGDTAAVHGQNSSSRKAGREKIAPPILPEPRLSVDEKIQILRERHKEHNDLDTASMRAITLQRQLLEENNLPYFTDDEDSTAPAHAGERS
ncbi:MAG: hypothetical protein ACOC9Y_09920 [Chloroflexota bacterium]